MRFAGITTDKSANPETAPEGKASVSSQGIKKEVL
jgi:hypothetical protein